MRTPRSIDIPEVSSFEHLRLVLDKKLNYTLQGIFSDLSQGGFRLKVVDELPTASSLDVGQAAVCTGSISGNANSLYININGTIKEYQPV